MAISSASGVLATQSLLYAMGLGAGSLPFAAALNWVIKVILNLRHNDGLFVDGPDGGIRGNFISIFITS